MKSEMRIFKKNVRKKENFEEYNDPSTTDVCKNKTHA